MFYRRKSMEVDAIQMPDGSYVVKSSEGVKQMPGAEFERDFEPAITVARVEAVIPPEIPVFGPRVFDAPNGNRQDLAEQIDRENRQTDVLACFGCGQEVKASTVDEEKRCRKCQGKETDADPPPPKKKAQGSEAGLSFCEECEAPFLPQRDGQKTCGECFRGGGRSLR